MFYSKLFILFVVLNVVYGSYETPYFNAKRTQLFQQRSTEYDNSDIWFTKNIHGEIKNNENMQDFNDIFSQNVPSIQLDEKYQK